MVELLFKSFNLIKPMYRKVAIISILTTLLTIISYLLIYSFLYGFYFGGKELSFNSNFNMIKNFIPFEYNTLLLTGLFGSLGVSCITMTFPLAKKKKEIMFIAPILFVFIHGIFTIYFVGDLDNYIKFLPLWIGPLIIAVMIWIFSLGLSDPLGTLINIINGLVLVMTLLVLLASMPTFKVVIPQYYDYSAATFTILFLIWPIIMNLIKGKKLYVYFHYLWLFVLLLIALQIVSLLLSSLNIIAYIVTLFVYYLIVNKVFKPKYEKRPGNDSEVEITPDQNNEYNLNKEIKSEIDKFNALFFILAILLTTIFVLGPQVTGITGIYIRNVIPVHSEIQNISINIDSDKKFTVIGRLILANDGVLYISNEEWELEMIKAQTYYVNSPPLENNI